MGRREAKLACFVGNIQIPGGGSVFPDEIESHRRSVTDRARERAARPSLISSGPWVNECGYLNTWCGSDRSVVSLRATPFHGYAIQVTVGLTNEFGSAPNRGVRMAVETPLRILLEGTIFGFWKAAAVLVLADTELRRPKSIDQMAAGNPIQGRYVHRNTRRHELLGFVPADRDLNKTLPKGLKQLFVCGVLVVVTRGTASHQERSTGDSCDKRVYGTRKHPSIMPPSTGRTKVEPPAARKRLHAAVAFPTHSSPGARVDGTVIESRTYPLIRKPRLIEVPWISARTLKALRRAFRCDSSPFSWAVLLERCHHRRRCTPRPPASWWVTGRFPASATRHSGAGRTCGD